MIEYILKKSLEENIVIQIIYNKDENITKRNIKVKDIKENRVKAYCYLRKDIRYFKLENILSAKLLNYGSQKWKI